jgi:DNA polymerase-3 subunit alpha
MPCIVGPIVYIPSFVKRKTVKKIIYDLDACEELLKDTYGITVYQGNAFVPKLADF